MSRLERELFLRKGAKRNLPSINKKTREGLIKQARMRLVSNPIIFKDIYENCYENYWSILFFRKKKDDISIWSHYSNGHRGLCIEFAAFADVAFSKMMLLGQALKVNYSEIKPIVNVINIGELKEYGNALLTKSSHWAFEEEWRIIKTEPEGGLGCQYFHPGVLTGVIFGALIRSNEKQKVIEWVKKYPILIALYLARINEEKYILDIEPI